METLELPFGEWRQIPGWEHYEASSEGEIRRADTGRILTQTLKQQSARDRRRGLQDRYYNVNLTFHDNKGKKRPKRSKTFRVHVLICLTFHGPRPPGCDAHHADEDWRNNRADNLEWKDEAQHRADHAYRRAMAPA